MRQYAKSETRYGQVSLLTRLRERVWFVIRKFYDSTLYFGGPVTEKL